MKDVHEIREHAEAEGCPDPSSCACECRTCKRIWFAAGRPRIVGDRLITYRGGVTESQILSDKKDDAINPSHYKQHPSGVEAIQICEHMTFCLGNATKYIWRSGLKSDNPVEDLKKAIWYIQREIVRIEGSKK